MPNGKGRQGMVLSRFLLRVSVDHLAMSDQRKGGNYLWYPASTKNAVIFILILLLSPLPALAIIKWMFHLSAVVFVGLIPLLLLGSIMLLRPNWITRMEEKQKRDLARFGKWNWPGFP
jgi:protein-S-isoprenylcysteine O-methyltransferase Ste14